MWSAGRYGSWNPTNVQSSPVRPPAGRHRQGGTPRRSWPRALAVEVRRILRDDGVARLERQQRATRLRSWVDRDGMWCLTGRFDPETGLTLHGRLDATVAALFTDQVPDGCPVDPLERHDSSPPTPWWPSPTVPRRRLAAAPRCSSWSTSPTPTPPTPAVDWGLPVELPNEVLHRLFPVADGHPVVVTEASSSTPPASSTWDAPPGWPTGPNAAPCGPCTRRAPSPAAPPASTVQDPPHPLVGTRGNHRPPQPGPVVLETPPRRPRPALAPHPHPQPAAHHHLSRRHHQPHRTTPRAPAPATTGAEHTSHGHAPCGPGHPAPDINP